MNKIIDFFEGKYSIYSYVPSFRLIKALEFFKKRKQRKQRAMYFNRKYLDSRKRNYSCLNKQSSLTRAQSSRPQEFSSLVLFWERGILPARERENARSHEVEGCNLEWITAEVTKKSRVKLIFVHC